MKAVTDFLFAKPSFSRGAAQILDFGNTLHKYNYPVSPQQADYLALRADWIVTGKDIWTAIYQFNADLPELSGPLGIVEVLEGESEEKS